MLVDQLREALAKGELRRTQVGLASLRRLLTELPKHSGQLDGHLTGLELQVFEIYGLEWRALLDCLRGVQNAGMTTIRDDVRHQLARFVFDITTDSLSAGTLTATRDLSGSVARLWHDMHAKGTQWTPSDAEFYLTRLREVSRFWLSKAKEEDKEAPLLQILASVYASAIKMVLDEHQYDAAKQVIDIFGDVRTYLPDANSEPFEQYRDATLLVIDAWWLLNIYEKGARSERDQMVHREVIRHLGNERLWRAILMAHDDEFEHALKWSWWDLPPTHGRVVSGFFEMSTYVDIAGLILASHVGMAVPEDESDQSVNLARRLLDLIARIEEQKLPWISELMPTADGFVQMLKTELGNRIEAWEVRNSQILADADIDPGALSKFCDVLIDSYRSQANLVGEIAQNSSKNLNPPELAFGVNKLESKDWFVAPESNGVDPVYLAESLGEALASGEDALLTKALTSIEGKEADDLDMIAAALEWWASGLPGEEKYFVTSSWLMVQSLSRKHDEAGHTNEVSHRQVTSSGVPIIQVYTADRPFVAGFVTPGGIRVSRYPMEKNRDGDLLLEQERLLVGVHELGSDELERLLERFPERTELELRQKVSLRVLERITVTAENLSKVSVWFLPESSY